MKASDKNKLLREAISEVEKIFSPTGSKSGDEFTRLEREAIRKIDEAEVIDLNDKDEKGETLLHAAIRASPAILVKLIEKGADINVANNFGYTPLHQAAFIGNLQLVDKILEKNPRDINSRNYLGKTALSEAIVQGKLAVAERLLERNATVNTKDNLGNAPLHDTAIYNRPSIIGKLIHAHADIDIRNNAGLTPLYESIIRNHLSVTDELIKKGADLNLQNERGWTPLHESINRGQSQISEKLIEKGANLNIKGNEGFSPLHMAVFNNQTSTLGELIRKGADLSIKDHGGHTPLHEAILLGRLPSIKILIEKGADLKAIDNKGLTPLELAKEKKYLDAQKLLEQTKQREFKRSTREIHTGGSNLYLARQSDFDNSRPQLQGKVSDTLSTTQELNNIVVGNVTLLLELMARKLTGEKYAYSSDVTPIPADKYLAEKVDVIEQSVEKAFRTFSGI